MRRTAALMIPLLFVAACASPRDQCISSVTRDLRVVDALVAQTQANLARGYALTTETEVRTIPQTCSRENADGSVSRYRCDQIQTYDRDVPVTINVAEERIKLDQLLTRQAALRTATGPAVQQCVATYPDA